MAGFLLAVAVFVATHLIPAWRPLRGRLVAAVGERAYMVLYSILSLAVLGWLGWAYGEAPYEEIWPYAEWTPWVPTLVMPFSCTLLVAGLSAPNPLSVALTTRGFDPERPGIAALTRHPLMWSLALWAAAHMVPNGDVASVVLFGLFLAISLYGPVSLDRKCRSRLGEAEWRRLSAATSNFPFDGVFGGRARLRLGEIGVWRVAAGLALYAVLLVGHEWAVGVWPLAA